MVHILQSNLIDKDDIPWDDIDKEIRSFIRELNKFPFCATTSCCQGHPHEWYLGPLNEKINHYKWIADCYISLQVYDEIPFLQLIEKLQRDFYYKVGRVLLVHKHIDFDRPECMDTNPKTEWRISFYGGGDKKEEIDKILDKGRKLLLKRIRAFRKTYDRKRKELIDWQEYIKDRPDPII